MTAKLTTAQRAARLPAPRPGLVIEIPLDLWPAYRQLHGIDAMQRADVSKVEERTGMRKPAGIVMVKRTTNGEQHA